jgi:hypothetical protein
MSSGAALPLGPTLERCEPPERLRDRLVRGRKIEDTPAAAVAFSLGALDMIGVLFGELVGRNLITADALDRELTRHGAFWHREGYPSRAAASEIVSEVIASLKCRLAEEPAHRTYDSSGARH